MGLAAKWWAFKAGCQFQGYGIRRLQKKGKFCSPKLIINIAKGTTNPGLWQIPVTTFTNPCNNFDKCIKQLFLAVKLISARLDKQIDRTSFQMISLHTEIESVSLQIAEKTIVWRFEQMQSSIPLKWLWYCPGIIAARFCHNKDDLPMKWSVATRASSHAWVTSVKCQQHLNSQWVNEWVSDWQGKAMIGLGPHKNTKQFENPRWWLTEWRGWRAVTPQIQQTALVMAS